VGRYADPTLFIWSIAWWPYALSHRLNPIVTHAIYAPVGTNLAWLTTVPLASVLVWPITAACGPIVSYNLLALLAAASAAWAAYILCRYLTKSVWPAILGGYVFGFSPYFLAQTLAGHLHMVLILPVPIVLYLVARWFDGALESRKMACLAGLAIAAQLLLSLEVFATATMFAGLALLLGFGSATVDTRRRSINRSASLDPLVRRHFAAVPGVDRVGEAAAVGELREVHAAGYGNFFGVAGINEWKALWTAPEVAYRKSTAFEANPMAAAAWLRQGERVAQQIRTEPYNQQVFVKALYQIRKLTTCDADVFVPRATDLCRSAGVALVFLAKISKTATARLPT